MGTNTIEKQVRANEMKMWQRKSVVENEDEKTVHSIKFHLLGHQNFWCCFEGIE